MIEALDFDVSETISDTGSLVQVCEQSLPGRGISINLLWRTTRLEYIWVRSLMNRYEDVWRVTKHALAFMSLDLRRDPSRTNVILDSYFHLPLYSELPDALAGLPLVPRLMLSNGT